MPTSISENNKRIAKNTIYMYMRMLVMLFISLFTSRVIFNALGVDNYGIYNVVGSVIVFFSFLNNGLSLATKRYITAELANGDEVSQGKNFSLAMLAHIYIALIVLVLAETIGLWAVNSLLKIPTDRMFAANVVYQLSVFSAVVGIIQSPYGSAIVAHEKMSVYAYFSIFDVIFKLLIVFAVKWIVGDKLIIYGLLLFFVCIANFVIYYIYCRRVFPQYCFKTPKERSGLRGMFGYMGWSLAGQGMVVLTNQGVTMLINVFVGVAVNAAMGISNTITNIVSQFVSNFQVAFNPQITKYYVAGDTQNLNQLIYRASRYSSFLVLIFLIPIIFQADTFLSLWLGDYPEYSVQFCVLTVLCIYFEALSGPLWMLIGSDTNIRRYQIIVSSIFSINFIGSWILLYLGFPPYNVIVVRMIVCVMLIVARLILCKQKISSFSIGKWVCDTVLRSVAIVAIPVFVNLMMLNITYPNKVIEFLSVCSISVILIVIGIYILGLNIGERKLVYSKVRSIVCR